MTVLRDAIRGRPGCPGYPPAPDNSHIRPSAAGDNHTDGDATLHSKHSH
jgi:hypothetical protein